MQYTTITMIINSIFTLRANQKIYVEMIAKRNADKQYIESLEKILVNNNLDLPEKFEEIEMLQGSYIGSHMADLAPMVSSSLPSLNVLHSCHKRYKHS